MKEQIIVYGDTDNLKEIAAKYRDGNHNVGVREFRAFRAEKEEVDRVVMTREVKAVRDFYEARDVPVELDTREAKPAMTREEIDDMKQFFKKRAAIKELTGQCPNNTIEANYLLNQHFGPKA
jgi:hypothetical protein